MTTERAGAPSAADDAFQAHRIFSGIQPSGIVHLGNDLGAIRNYVALQEQFEAVYCIVDYHALTSLHDADALRRQTREMAASLLALGLDPEKCTLFVQSHRPEHTELAWLLATVTPVSWVERTPTYKEKKEQQPDDVNHALLTYPILQAADIVIYQRRPRPGRQGPGRPPRAEPRDRPGVQPPLRRDVPRARGRLHRGADRPRHGRRPEDEQVGRQHDRDPRRARHDPETGHVDGHRHAADPADPARAGRRSATSASSTGSSARTTRRSGTASGRHARAASTRSGCWPSGSSPTTRRPGSATWTSWPGPPSSTRSSRTVPTASPRRRPRRWTTSAAGWGCASKLAMQRRVSARD